MKIFSYIACSLMLPCSFLFGGISGTYCVHGENPDGTTYTGTLIIEKSGKIYHSKWILNNGSSTGTGVREGNFLAFDFVGVNGQGDPIVGVQLFKISKGVLEGPWAINGLGTRGFEKDVKINLDHHQSHSSSH